jgi:hypothetical protein
MAASPTERSLKLLRKEGWEPAVVERWNAHARIRQDLWGFVDLIAMKAGEPPLLVQSTSAANLAARRTKIAAEPRARLALTAGFRVVLHGWRPTKTHRGQPPRIEEVTLALFEELADETGERGRQDRAAGSGRARAARPSGEA